MHICQVIVIQSTLVGIFSFIYALESILKHIHASWNLPAGTGFELPTFRFGKAPALSGHAAALSAELSETTPKKVDLTALIEAWMCFWINSRQCQNETTI